MAARKNVPTDQEISDFFDKVLSFSLQKFGLVYKDVAQSSLFTEDIGNAVVILQLLMRDMLRDRLFHGFEKMFGVLSLNQGYQTIRQLLDSSLDQSMEDHSKPAIFLGYLALLAELVIFLESAAFPVPKEWFTHIWSVIYEERLKDKVAGGWEGLKAEAKSLCDDFPNKEELFEELEFIEHPYAEIDPMVEMSSKEMNPFFMFFTLCTGFEFPKRAGLTKETLKNLFQDLEMNTGARQRLV